MVYPLHIARFLVTKACGSEEGLFCTVVDGPSVQPCHRSDSPLSAAEPFRLPLPPSGTHRGKRQLTVIAASPENLSVPALIPEHCSVVNPP